MTEPAPALAAAQQDLSRAYAGGAPGVFVSGLVWLIAGTVWQLHGINGAFVALLIGGMVIAWVLLVRAPDLAIPVFAAIIGARYFLFRTLYGEMAYWALGGAILLVAGLALFDLYLPLNLGFLIGAIELVAAASILRRWRARR